MRKAGRLFANRLNILWFLLIMSGLTFLYGPVILSLADDWIHLPDFSHGFLIPFVSLYVVYEERKEWSPLIRTGHWSGVVWIIGGLLFLFLGNLATEFFIMRFSLLIVVGGIILFLLGTPLLKKLSFPLGYLIFMIPIPSIFLDRITFPLQLFASKVAAASLDLMGIPALREGNVIQLANTNLEVAEACSGIRSLIALMALAVAFAYFSQRSTFKRVLLVLSTVPIAVIANALRVSGTGILAHYYGDSMAQGFFHSFSGWLLFVIAFICLIGVSALLAQFKDGDSNKGPKR
jgi:exosortase A